MSKFLKFIVHFIVICTIVCVVGLAVPPFLGITTEIMDDSTKETNLPIGSVTYAIPSKTADAKVGDFILYQGDSAVYRYMITETDKENNIFKVVDSSDPSAEVITVEVKDYIPKVVITIGYVGYLLFATESIEGLIILALLINEVRGKFFKRSVQTVVYLPHFISAVVVVSILSALLSPSSGLINQLITAFGGTPIHFMAEPKYFKTIYVLSDIWQSAGYGSIVYMAALTGIDPSLYEAATVDGASKWDKLIHITLPGLLPTIIIMLILRMGSIFSVGYEKIMLMYNPATYETADVISTYVYRRAFESGDYSFSAAVGLFNSVINFTIIVLFNKFSKKISEVSLW